MNKFIWGSFFAFVIIVAIHSADRYDKSGGTDIPPTAKSGFLARNAAVVLPSFKDKTLEWRLNAEHHESGKTITGLNEVMGGGVCVFDYNNDGWDDVFVVGGSGHHRYYGRQAWWTQPVGNTLWENTGKQTFVNVTARAKIPKTEWGMGCATGDLNNDGAIDLLILNIGANTLLKNNGNGTFTDVTSQSGLAKDKSWSLSASMADYDHDGLLDIYIVNFVDYKKDERVFERSSGFLDPVSQSFDPVLYNSQPNNLYKNTGSFHFVDKAVELAVDDATGRGEGARWLDVNNDGYADLAVLNSAGTPNQLYINRKGKKFQTEQSIYHIESTVGSRSAAAGDIDNDGDIDLIIAEPAGTPPMLLINGDTPVPVQTAALAARDGFQDLTWQMGLARDDLLYLDSWGSVVADVNNDGWPDLYMANGLASIDPDSGHVTVGQGDDLWVNRNGRFEKVDIKDPYQLPSRGVVAADFNNDGKQDLIVSENNGFVRLLMNTTKAPGNWLGIRFVPKNIANGAIVSLSTKSSHQLRQVYPDSSYLSQGSGRLHFGIADDDSVLQLKVKLPDGSERIIKDVKVNQYNDIDKGWKVVAAQAEKSAKSRSIITAYESFNAVEKIALINALSIATNDKRAVDVLVNATYDKEQDVRMAALQALSSSSDKLAFIGALYRALSDNADTIRIAAVDYLKKLELERSVYWLIVTLSDNSSDVKCHVANTFEHFFREEEAVVNRKYLAVRHLIFLLKDRDPRVRVCAERALAESERYRAVMPLIHSLADVDENVRANAARALGYLRDKQATAPLLAVVEGQSETARVKADALIALHKLGYKELDKQFSRLFIKPTNVKDIQSGLGTVSALLHDNDEVVFDPNKLKAYQTKLIVKYCAKQHSRRNCIKKMSDNNKMLASKNREQRETDKFNQFVKSLGIKANKELINIVDNNSAPLARRMEALRYLAEQKHPFAKTYILNMIKSKQNDNGVAEIGLLSNFIEDSVIQKILWGVFDDKSRNVSVRLAAAKVLMTKEQQSKVLDKLMIM